MPVYLAPGVYVEEKLGSPPIAGVGTSTAAFIGIVDNAVVMPKKPTSGAVEESYVLAAVNTPVAIANFEQFKNNFGNFQVGNKVLAHAVYGFFLNGGSNCYVIRVDDFDDIQQADGPLKQLAKIDEIAIVAAPGALDAGVQNAIATHCKTLEDRFAILDGQVTESITVNDIKGGTGNSDYAALYFPQIKVFNQTLDPATNKRPAGEAEIVDLPPSGHLAGIYARVDQSRGVFKAPANETVAGALGLKYLVTKDEQKILNPKGINVIRGFDGNFKVYGARTLGGEDNGEFRYINVRRTMNFLKESIDEGMQFVVFEPNSPVLWQRIIRTLRAFLTIQWRDGLLFGNTPEEAFFVRCDESLNPKEVRDIGQVITEIGVAIVRPAEFVIFRISQEVGTPG
jgi:hypothetical protein